MPSLVKALDRFAAHVRAALTSLRTRMQNTFLHEGMSQWSSIEVCLPLVLCLIEDLQAARTKHTLDATPSARARFCAQTISGRKSPKERFVQAPATTTRSFDGVSCMIRRTSAPPQLDPASTTWTLQSSPISVHPSANFPTVTVMTEWLTAAEAAAHLKVRPRTLLLWVRQGRIPAHRLSGVRRCVWRFLRSELDAMLTPSSAGAAQEEAC